MIRTSLLALTATALLLTGCSGSSDEDTDTRPTARAGDESAPAAATEGASTGNLLVTGTVTSDGAPLADARVYAVIWPLDDTDAEDTLTESFDSAVATTDAAGAFSVSVDAATIPPAYFTGTTLTYDLTVETADDLEAELRTTAYLVEGTWRTAETSTVDGSVDAVSVDLSGRSATRVDSQGESGPADIEVTQYN